MLPLDQYWADYAGRHQSNYNFEMAKFVADLAASLRCQNVLEVGCSSGNDLTLVTCDASGIDSNESAVSVASERLPQLEFRCASALSIPYGDSTFDLVFARNLLNHVEDDKVQKIMEEMLRVSGRYVLNIELFSDNESILSEDPIRTAGRNIKERWMDHKVKIISNVDMHEEIDPKKSRFTLVRKM